MQNLDKNKKLLVSVYRLKLISGFTLLEILVVLTIIGIMATVMMVIINPAHQLAKARDTQRETDIYSIVATIQQYTTEHSGTLPDTDGNPLTNNFPTTLTCIGNGGGCFNLASAGDGTDSIVPTYLASLPKDPKTGTNANTGYKIMVDINKHLTASASGETETIILTK
jgi:prepilin-type N-terminal cleavage/methylation domain-containing protein